MEENMREDGNNGHPTEQGRFSVNLEGDECFSQGDEQFKNGEPLVQFFEKPSRKRTKEGLAKNGECPVEFFEKPSRKNTGSKRGWSDFEPGDASSTPKKKNSTSSPNSSETKEEFASPNSRGAGSLIKTKASGPRAVYSFQDEFLDSITQMHRKGIGNIHSYLESEKSGRGDFLHTSVDLGVATGSPASCKIEKMSDKSFTGSESSAMLEAPVKRKRRREIGLSDSRLSNETDLESCKSSQSESNITHRKKHKLNRHRSFEEILIKPRLFAQDHNTVERNGSIVCDVERGSPDSLEHLRDVASVDLGVGDIRSGESNMSDIEMNIISEVDSLSKKRNERLELVKEITYSESFASSHYSINEFDLNSTKSSEDQYETDMIHGNNKKKYNVDELLEVVLNDEEPNTVVGNSGNNEPMEDNVEIRYKEKKKKKKCEDLLKYSTLCADIHTEIEQTGGSPIHESSVDTNKHKKKKKKKICEDLLQDSTLRDDIQIEIEQTGESPIRESSVDTNKHKKKKKKKKCEDLLKDSTLRDDIQTQIEQTGESPIRESSVDTNKHKKKKKKKKCEDLLEDSTLRDDIQTEIEQTGESAIQEASVDTNKHKKKKKKKIREDSTLRDDIQIEQTGESPIEESSVDTNKHKKKKKKKICENLLKDSTSRDDIETEIEQTGESPTQESSVDTNKHKKKKKKKESREDHEQESDGDVLRDCTSNQNFDAGRDGEKQKKKKKRRRSEDEEPRVPETKENHAEASTGKDSSFSEVAAKRPKKGAKMRMKADSLDSQCDIGAVKRQKKKKKPPQRTVSQLKKLFTEHSFQEIEEKTGRRAEESDDEQDSINKSLEALEEANERMLLSDEEVKSLKTLHVILPWSVPAVHLIETQLTRKVEDEQQRQLDELGVPIKTGNFSKAEDHRIKKNWKQFCKHHDVPQNAALPITCRTRDGKMLLPLAQRILFARFLAHRLEDRLLSSVYNRFKRLVAQEGKRSGRFTAKEDKLMVDFLKKSTSGTPYADLAKILNRDRLSVEKRCRKLAEHVTGHTEKITWDTATIQEFLKELVHLARVKDIEELRNREITTQEWKEMGERLNQPVMKLRSGWFTKVYSKLFVKARCSTVPIRRRLISLMMERGQDDWRTVNWAEMADEIGKEFEGFPAPKLSKMFRHMVAYHVPEELRKDLKACLKVLKNETFRNGKVRRLKIVDNRPKSTEVAEPAIQ